MTLSRRDLLAAAGGAAAFIGAGPAAAQVAATPGLRPGKPFAGTELKVLCVVASQFRAHEARLAAFTEQTGITAKYTFIPFASMREALTAEMVGGGGDFCVAFCCSMGAFDVDMFCLFAYLSSLSPSL